MHAYVYSSIRAHAYMYVCVCMCMYARYISVTNMYHYKTYGELGKLKIVDLTIQSCMLIYLYRHRIHVPVSWYTYIHTI